MPDQVTKVTKVGWGSRLGSSFSGILIGLILFVGSFVVLYWNEGRVDLSQVAQNAVEVSSSQVDADKNGQFIHTTGKFSSTEKLGDDYLKEGDYIVLERNVEIYAWVENTESTTETKLGGSEETTTTYTYEQEWVSEPTLSGFEVPEGHENKAKTIEDLEKRVTAAKIGVYNISDMQSVFLPGTTPLTLTNENAILPFGFKLSNDQYIFNGFGTMDNPYVGDMRISYKILKPNDNATIFGQLNGDSIDAFYGEDKATIYRIFYGSADQAVAQMATEHKTMTWIFRVIGFLMMWFGLTSIFAPLSVLLDVLPILGKVSRSIVSLVMFVVSLVLSILTIVISMVAHSFLIIVIMVAAVLVVGFLIYKNIKEKKGGKKEEKSVDSPDKSAEPQEK